MTRNFAGAVLLAAVLGIGVGAGAACYQTQQARPTPAAARTAGPAQAGAPNRPGGFGGGAATIEKVDSSTATVKTGNGSSVDVQLASATLQKQEKAAPADLKVGDNVFGRGDADAAGVVTLRNLQIVANAPQRGGGQGQGGPPPGQEQAQGGQRGFVAGSVAKIDGPTLTVNPPNGSPVTARLASDAQIEKVVPAQPSDLKAGQSVAMQRPPNGGTTVLTITSGS